MLFAFFFLGKKASFQSPLICHMFVQARRAEPHCTVPWTDFSKMPLRLFILPWFRSAVSQTSGAHACKVLCRMWAAKRQSDFSVRCHPARPVAGADVSRASWSPTKRTPTPPALILQSLSSANKKAIFQTCRACHCPPCQAR